MMIPCLTFNLLCDSTSTGIWQTPGEQCITLCYFNTIVGF